MDFIPTTQESQSNLDQEALLHRITKRVRQSLELEEILAATVAEVRSFLGTDRVKVYRFHQDESGEVIAESIHDDRLPALLGLNFPADDIPPEARELFRTARLRSIVNVASQQIGLSILDCPETGTSLDCEDIRYRPVDPCHVEYLTAMGVQSSLVVPILHSDQLWGLLVSHHAEPRVFSERELQILQLVVDQVSIAIAQSTLFNRTREQAQREATINQVATLLHSLPTIKLKEALEATVTVLQGCGGRLYINVENLSKTARAYTCGDQPLFPASSAGAPQLLEQRPQWQALVGGGFKHALTEAIRPESPAHQRRSPWAIADLYKEPQLRTLAAAFRPTSIRGLLILPLQYRQQLLGYLTIFRDEIETERLWAGQIDPDQRQLQARLSFEAWRELKKGQAQEWTLGEIELAQALSNHFSMAIQQYELYEQVQALNANLECQVEERTAELQQSLEVAGVLKRVTDQIRSTLDLKTTLQTIVREVRGLLDTNRVLIYQLTHGRQGEVVVEAVDGEWRSVLGMMGPEDCFPEEFAQLYQAGRVRAIANALEADLAPCHLEFLQSMQIQASLVVPICMGNQLWGLLIAHECGAPRVWQTSETDLLQQLADQAAIAIQQAELYQQSQAAVATATAQAQQLEQTLQNLQQTQAQLVQSMESDKVLQCVTDQIRSTLDSKTILQTIVREVRALLATDRAVIYQFDRNWQGEVVVEEIGDKWGSILGKRYQDECFPKEHALLYQGGRIRAIDQVAQSDLHPCHIEFLLNIQVQANLVVPIRMGEQLWGLLIVHQCSAPRRWQATEIDLLQQLADQAAIALQQAELYEKTRTAAITATTQAQQLEQAFRDLQQAQTQLIQGEKMSSLGQLVAGVAHEINNPVNFIYGNLSHAGQYTQDLLNLLQLYQEHYPQPHPTIADQAEAIDLDFLTKDLPKILASMKVGADRIRQIVMSLRNFSRFDQAEMKPICIHEGIDSTLLILQHRLKARVDFPEIRVVKDYGNLPPVECYAGQLNQVFMNILSNAIDALEEYSNQRSIEEIRQHPAQITIRTALLDTSTGEDPRVVIRIADNGPGIPAAVQARIFDPFFTTKPVGQGTGLGLSISYQIVVERHGGVFKCVSQPRQGAEFWIEIPIRQPPQFPSCRIDTESLTGQSANLRL